MYPDYLAAPKVDTWIKAQLQRFYDEVPFDGLWLDMNEAANFCSGRLCKTDPKNSTSMHCKEHSPSERAVGGGSRGREFAAGGASDCHSVWAGSVCKQRCQTSQTAQVHLKAWAEGGGIGVRGIKHMQLQLLMTAAPIWQACCAGVVVCCMSV